MVFHDLIPLMNPEVYLSDPNIKNHYERKIQWLKNTNLLLAVSEYTRSEAIRVLGFNSDQLVTIWNAVDSYFKQTNQSLHQSAKLCELYGITRKIVMCTLAGGFDPHKNIVGLLTAYSLLPVELRQEYQLVLVSKISDDVRSKLDLQSKQLGLTENDLVLTGYVEDEDLVSLAKKDFASGCLSSDSFIITSLIFTADSSQIEYKAGKITSAKIKEVQNKLVEVFTR